jgi:hypothetical protein
MCTTYLVGVEEDAGVVLLVGTGEGNARRLKASATSDSNLETEWVELSAVQASTAVQGEELKS